MPLVIPGLSNVASSSNDAKSEWQQKLVGKKLSDSSTDGNSFAKSDLPKHHRVVEPGSFVTADHNPKRLNVHVDKDGTITHVNFK